jgi:hypothetical protein
MARALIKKAKGFSGLPNDPLARLKIIASLNRILPSRSDARMQFSAGVPRGRNCNLFRPFESKFLW